MILMKHFDTKNKNQASSEAAPGNDNVNSKFPFRKEIARSYQKIVENLLYELIEPCLEAGDIKWACDISKEIFTPSQEAARKHILEPQNAFKKSVMAGDGEGEVAEWRTARVFMYKLQRVTRGRILASSKEVIRTWLDGEVRNNEEGPLSRLKAHTKYNGALEECYYQLTQVGCSVL